MRPMSARASVVLPDPDSPTRARFSPAKISIDRSSITRLPPRVAIERPAISTIASDPFVTGCSFSLFDQAEDCPIW